MDKGLGVLFGAGYFVLVCPRDNCIMLGRNMIFLLSLFESSEWLEEVYVGAKSTRGGLRSVLCLLAMLKLHFPVFPSLQSSGLAWVSKDVFQEIWKQIWSISHMIFAVRKLE